MNNTSKYIEDIDDALKKIKNNSDYFNSFGDIYIMNELKNHLDIIYEEINKVKSLALEVNDNSSVRLEPGSNS